MAFLNVVPLATNASTRLPSKCIPKGPVMSVGKDKVSRRQALGLAVTFGVGLFGATAAAKADKDELKKELEGFEYQEELTDVGPTDAAELQVREKKVEAVPEYVAEQKEIEEESDKKFEEMVAEEASDAAQIRAKFGKK